MHHELKGGIPLLLTSQIAVYHVFPIQHNTLHYRGVSPYMVAAQKERSESLNFTVI
uniref:Uncharacterized protein n=1 Tax=Arundo donax TaxID=35708 RepID=A0A0A9H509_ARUDO